MSPYLRAEGRPEKPWGRGGADGLPRGLGGLRDWGGEPGAEPGSPAVPTRGEQISVTPRAPPPPAPPASPPPSLRSSSPRSLPAWQLAKPLPARPDPPPRNPPEARAGTRVPQAGRGEESPAARDSQRPPRAPFQSRVQVPPAGPAAELACLLPGTGGEAIIN